MHILWTKWEHDEKRDEAKWVQARILPSPTNFNPASDGMNGNYYIIYSSDGPWPNDLGPLDISICKLRHLMTNKKHTTPLEVNDCRCCFRSCGFSICQSNEKHVVGTERLFRHMSIVGYSVRLLECSNSIVATCCYFLFIYFYNIV